MSTAIYNAKATSFITVDEFGRGTSGAEGVAILAGAIRKFLDKDEFCPHILVSTHLQQVLHYIPETPKVQALKMQHSLCEGKLVFSFQVVDGVSSSYALDMAKMTGLGDDIVQRAAEMLKSLQDNKPLTPLTKEPNVDKIIVLKIPKPNKT